MRRKYFSDFAYNMDVFPGIFSLLWFVNTCLPSYMLPLIRNVNAVSCGNLGADIGLVAADVLLELEELGGKLDLGLQEVLGVQVIGGGVAAVLL